MKKLLAAVFASTLLAAPLAGASGSANGTLTISVAIDSTCTVNNPTIVFGPLSDTVDNVASADILVTCTAKSGGTVMLDGVPGSRVLTNAVDGSTLPYELYTDVAETNAWGSAATPTMSLDSTMVTSTIPVFAVIKAASVPTLPATLTSGTYVATENITVNY